jgi:putative FmdB family regulatory protein
MTYDYACSACNHEWEAEQRISEDPLRICPRCGESTARRLVSGGAGFILKGGGWYADGYASHGSKASSGAKADGNGSSAASPKATSTGSSESSTSAGTKTESKASSGTAAA